MTIYNPVTDNEYLLDDDAVLMSTTDLESHISYANQAFIDASGYSAEELYGQPHNIIRHPDMPAAAFADMWKTLKSGLSWTGMVKNQRKDGSFYWVKANAAPVVNNGETTGYVSVRTCASRAEIATAQQLYAKMRMGHMRHKKLLKGICVFAGVFSFLSFQKRMSARGRVWMVCLFGLACMLSLIAKTDELGFLATLVSAAGVFTLLGFVLERQFVRPLKIILKQASDVATGKRPELIELGRVDELGMILRAINQAGLNMQSLVKDVNIQVDAICGATNDLSTDSDTLNVQTRQTSTSLQQTAAAVTQMTDSLASNANNAQQVAVLSVQAAQGSDTGAKVVSKLVDMMDRIHKSSAQINEIVALIDSIAFQTNLLALNAAVEAARAGTAGKGFAVVASEVRTLSERSTQAASEIRQLITDSGKEINEGARLADDAGGSMETLNQQIAELSKLINDISVAVVEQSAGVGGINTEVNNLDRVTSGNSLLVDRSSAAVSQLQARSERLSMAIALYTPN